MTSHPELSPAIPGWRERFDEAGNPRSFIRPVLREGYVTLLDSSRREVCEWHDKKFANAILNGEANIQGWGRLIKELALTRRYMTETEFGYVALNDKQFWNNDIPERWKHFIKE